MRYPRAIEDLIAQLSDLPSVGPKTAERYVFYLLKQPAEKIRSLAAALNELKEKTTRCHLCQAFAESDPCPICRDPNRATGVLCLVENTEDLAAIEATGQFNGRYFVLNGLINTIEDIKPENLPLDKLGKKIKTEQIKEVVLALNFTLEGETTALYLNKILKDHLKITRLAKGLPAGSDLEYADELTLASAFKNRQEIK